MNDLPWASLIVAAVTLVMFVGVLYQARRWNRRHGRNAIGVSDPAAEALWSRTPHERRRVARALARRGQPAADPDMAALVCAHSGRKLHSLVNPWEFLALWLFVLGNVLNGHRVLTDGSPPLSTPLSWFVLGFGVIFMVGAPILRLHLLRTHAYAYAYELNRPLAEQVTENENWPGHGEAPVPTVVRRHRRRTR